MIKFFRKIRQRLVTEILTSRRTGKISRPARPVGRYLIYAIGEIILVVIGILIALQINNWNERQKDRKASIEIYKNLHSSLQQDSIAVQTIIDTQDKSLLTQKSLILKDFEEFQFENGDINLDSFLMDIMFGTLSFYPKDGIYNLILSNNGIDLMESNQIKDAINNLYEYQYKRYENLDPVIENKFQYGLMPVTSKKLDFVLEFTPQVEIVSSTDPSLFKKHYTEVSAECKDIFSILSFVSLCHWN